LLIPDARGKTRRQKPDQISQDNQDGFFWPTMQNPCAGPEADQIYSVPLPGTRQRTNSVGTTIMAQDEAVYSLWAHFVDFCSENNQVNGPLDTKWESLPPRLPFMEELGENENFILDAPNASKLLDFDTDFCQTEIVSRTCESVLEEEIIPTTPMPINCDQFHVKATSSPHTVADFISDWPNVDSTNSTMTPKSFPAMEDMSSFSSLEKTFCSIESKSKSKSQFYVVSEDSDTIATEFEREIGSEIDTSTNAEFPSSSFNFSGTRSICGPPGLSLFA
jgi:hypothetical protein